MHHLTLQRKQIFLKKIKTFSQFTIYTGKQYPHSSINFKEHSYIYCYMYNNIHSIGEGHFEHKGVVFIYAG